MSFKKNAEHSSVGDLHAPCNVLAANDLPLRTALAKIDTPVVRRHDTGFIGLFRTIVGQQLSVASAAAIFDRCQKGLVPLNAKTITQHSYEELRAFGLSGSKVKYINALSEAVLNGTLDFQALAKMDDSTAFDTLRSIKGIGPWSAGIYLLFCEGRMDIWPQGDLALLKAYNAARADGQTAGEKAALPMKELDRHALQHFRPYRGVAAHILWTYYAYLSGKSVSNV